MKQTTSLLAHLRTVALPADAAMADGELLERFIKGRDEAAFAALVRRHAGMVHGVCHRVLGHAEDAEDAFQATFVVLVRKAASIRRRNLLANWLYGVAHRAALEAKAARRRVRERQVSEMPEPVAPEEDDPGRDLRPLLDRELARLPDKYRVAVVLCDLENRTRREAAQLVGVPEGTLSGRLTKARRMLARRLARSGLGCSGAALAAVLSASAGKAGAPAAPVACTVKAALGVAAGKATGAAVSPRVAALAEGVMKTMLLAKLKVTGLVLLALVLVGVPVGVYALAQPASREAPAGQRADSPPAAAEKSAETDGAQAEARALRGTWTQTVTETITRNGVPEPPRQKKVTYVISGSKFIRLGEDGLIDEEMTLRLDPAQKPKAIDLISLRTGTDSGIYRLEGDILTIYFGAEEGQRPTGFPDKPIPACLWILKRSSRTPARTAVRFPNAEGCFWMIEPTSPASLMATLGIVWIYEKDRDGAALITLAGALPGSREPEYRPVLLDAGKKRYLPDPLTGGFSGRRGGHDTVVALGRWRMDPKVLPADKVNWLGVEAVTPEYHRSAGRAAQEKARRQGVEVFPWPEVGKRFDFVLTTTEGKKVRSRDLRGKVVVIDCWATWCSPCVALLPELKHLYEKRHADGLVVLGVSLDEDAGQLRKACERLALPWPQAMVPGDEAARQLWYEATGIRSIPRLFIIDQEGILRADTPKELEGEVGKLLKEAPAAR